MSTTDFDLFDSLKNGVVILNLKKPNTNGKGRLVIKCTLKPDLIPVYTKQQEKSVNQMEELKNGNHLIYDLDYSVWRTYSESDLIQATPIS